MSSQYLIALLLLVVLVALVALPSVRSFFADQLARLRRRASPPPPRRASTGTTLIRANGEEIELPLLPRPAGGTLAARVEALGGQRRLVILAIAGLIALVAGVQLYRYALAPTRESFVVLIAPFNDSGGGVGQTGREVASALAANMFEASGRRVIARAIGQPPADAAAALELIKRDGADALVLGTIEPG